ncbi:HAD-IA family hydrolase, partial [bacterium]|nr:HAD-IA family hydrolase [bacterium]
EVDCRQVIRLAAVADNAIYRFQDQNQGTTLDDAMAELTWQSYLKQLEEITGLGRMKTIDLFRKWHNHWAVPGTQVQPFQDAVKVLCLLHDRGFSIGVLSNGEWDLEPICRRDGFGEIIQITLTSGSVGYQKPDHHIFDIASQTVNAIPSKCALIGDTIETDIEGAQNAGWLPVFLQRPSRRYARTVTSDVLVVSSLSQLLDAFV